MAVLVTVRISASPLSPFFSGWGGVGWGGGAFITIGQSKGLGKYKLIDAFYKAVSKIRTC